MNRIEERICEVIVLSLAALIMLGFPAWATYAYFTGNPIIKSMFVPVAKEGCR